MVASDPASGTARYSACAPNRPSQYPKTRSPALNDATPLPTASTTPANSLPRTLTLGRMSPVNNRTMKGLAARNPQSVRFTVVACTLTSTWLALTAGFSTSAIRTTSGGPYLVCTAAFIGEL